MIFNIQGNQVDSSELLKLTEGNEKDSLSLAINSPEEFSSIPVGISLVLDIESDVSLILSCGKTFSMSLQVPVDTERIYKYLDTGWNIGIMIQGILYTEVEKAYMHSLENTIVNVLKRLNKDNDIEWEVLAYHNKLKVFNEVSFHLLNDKNPLIKGDYREIYINAFDKNDRHYRQIDYLDDAKESTVIYGWEDDSESYERITGLKDSKKINWSRGNTTGDIIGYILGVGAYNYGSREILKMSESLMYKSFKLLYDHNKKVDTMGRFREISLLFVK